MSIKITLTFMEFPFKAVVYITTIIPKAMRVQFNFFTLFVKCSIDYNYWPKQ